MVNKKIILPLIAALMVVAGVFAMNAKKENTYGFLMAADGTTVTTTQVTDPSSLCPGTSSADCARKYNESQTQVVGGVRSVIPSQKDNEIDYRSKE